MFLQERTPWEINISPNQTPDTKVSSEITEILEQTPLISIKFYSPFSETTLFTGNGWFYKDDVEREVIKKRQKQNFLESGYTSHYWKDWLHASWFSIISSRFLKSYREKNRWFFWYVDGWGKPKNSWDFNFWDTNSYTIGEASYKDENNNTIIVPLYVLGKNGEGVLDEKQVQEFISLIK